MNAPLKSRTSGTDYAHDLRAWAFEQAASLKQGDVRGLDTKNIAEEIESLGNQQEWELYSRYLVLLTHLLKWTYQPERRSRSWKATIAEQRGQTRRLFRKSPSLKAVDEAEFKAAYETARDKASAETDLPVETFPSDPPFTAEQARDPDFWPEAAAAE